MRRITHYMRLLMMLPLFMSVAQVYAAVQLQINGVSDELKAAITENVNLAQYAKRQVSEAQVRRLYQNAPAQAQSALQPYGYYDASVTSTLQQVGQDWQVSLQVTAGAPVVVSAVTVGLVAQASALGSVHQAMQSIQKFKGRALNDGAYDDARDKLSAALTANGFLDAKLVTHRVEVHRAEHRATINLAWQVGQRYRYGQVHFQNSLFQAGFLQRYVPFKSGDYFAQNQLLELQQALNGADYFSMVDVQPDLDTAKNGIVDIDVRLTAAKRTVYTGGPFIGTDTGFGVRGGIERRWVNRHGHKWTNELVLAQRLKTLSTQYSIPLPGANQRSVNFGATYRDSNTDTSQSRTLELVADETQQWHGWTRTLGMHALDGTFTVGKVGNESDKTPGLEHGRSTEVFGEASLSRKQADDPTFVHRGWSLSVTARSTAGSVLSDARFSQLMVDAKWIRAFGANQRNRLILRGSAGITRTSNFDDLPPQLRFFAGGDRSVRGYSFQSLGPRNASNRVIGGENLLVASSEVEHYFSRRWGMAAFVDAGNAFTDTDFRPDIGAGLGVRWLSPVGMIRLDVGTPVHNSRVHGVELHLVIGPDL